MVVDVLEIPCPACGGVNTLLESSIPESGEVRCELCWEAIHFRARRAPDADSSMQVRCPACGHHFEAEGAADTGPTVLIVEDSDFFLKLARDVLGERYDTLLARTAKEARQYLATKKVDLLVLDLTLPDADGTEVLEALPRPDLPVLIYTSRDETTLLGPEWKLLQSLGADDVVLKGINIEETLMEKASDLMLRAQPVGI